MLLYIVPNADDSTKYTAYIQGDGVISANSDSGSLFDGFTNLKSIQNLQYLDTSKVTTIREMFLSCNSLTNLDLNSFNTSKVTNMSGVFWNCSGLTSLDLRNFDTSNVTNMSNMFNSCNNLKYVYLSSFNTSKVTNMSSMFAKCTCMNTTITIAKVLTTYNGIFSNAATATGSSIVVNYTSAVASVVDTYIAIKSTNSNVRKGSLVTI